MPVDEGKLTTPTMYKSKETKEVVDCRTATCVGCATDDATAVDAVEEKTVETTAGRKTRMMADKVEAD